MITANDTPNIQRSEPAQRQYPALPHRPSPKRPISFVVVHYCDDFFHNFMQSDCAKSTLNELIVVDNRLNLFHPNLSSAISEGIDRASHPLIAIVHEDVLLPTGWQAELETSIEALEKYDPDWGCLGAVGWTAEGQVAGHWSDPQIYCNLFSDKPYGEVARIDEQLMIIRKGRGVVLDSALPSIHNIGHDIPLTAMKTGRKTYVVNAPTIHKYADAFGNPILSSADSPKIQGRKTLTWLADKDCCDDYFFRKWASETVSETARDHEAAATVDLALATLAPPIVFLSRGGGGSRLLSALGVELGIFMGNAGNGSGDTIDMVNAIYKCVIEKYQCIAPWQKALPTQELRRGALRMLTAAGFPASWGFKLPEAMLIVPEILAAFPKARFVHLIRDPLATCLRRTHMTARLDNQIGQITLPLAYRYHGLPVAQILEDSPAVHMAYSTRQQLLCALDTLAALPADRYLEIRFEDMMRIPGKVNQRFARWLEKDPIERLRMDGRWVLDKLTRRQAAPSALEQAIDPQRAAEPSVRYSPEVEARVMTIVADLRARLGYQH